MIHFNIKVYQSPINYTQTEIHGEKALNSRYKEFAMNSSKLATIPGLKEGAIPQGMCYSKKYNMIIISAYHQGNASSVLFFLDFNTGKLVKTIRLINKDGTPFLGHAGGIATDEENFWISDNYKVYSYDLEELVYSANMESASFKESFETTTKADFLAYHNGILWIGEYHYSFIYQTKEEHHVTSSEGKKYNALLMGYEIKEKDFSIPSYVIAIPDRVQGLTFSNNNEIIISQSFWSFQSSNIKILDNVLEKDNSENYYIVKDKKVPLWFLDESIALYNLELPPMSEGVFFKNNQIYVLFESASNYYRIYTHDSIDYITKVDLP